MAAYGWIKLHRSILDNVVVARDPEVLSIWIYLLLKAAHKSGVKVAYLGTQYTLNAGQVATSRNEISEQLKIHPSKVQRVLIKLQNEQMIEQEITSRGRVISILNWDKFQSTEQQYEQTTEQESNKQRTSSEQPSEQPTLYNKKIKNDKNDNNINARARVRHADGVSVDKFTPLMDSGYKERLDVMRKDMTKRQREALNAIGIKDD